MGSAVVVVRCTHPWTRILNSFVSTKLCSVLFGFVFVMVLAGLLFPLIQRISANFLRLYKGFINNLPCFHSLHHARYHSSLSYFCFFFFLSPSTRNSTMILTARQRYKSRSLFSEFWSSQLPNQSPEEYRESLEFWYHLRFGVGISWLDGWPISIKIEEWDALLENDERGNCSPSEFVLTAIEIFVVAHL